MKTRAIVCVLVGLLLLVVRGAFADDWPQWRGPHRDDLSAETGLLKDWPQDGPPLLWKATGLGAGYSSIAVVGPLIYTAGDRDSTSFVVAIKTADGAAAWSAKLDKAGAPGWGDFEGPRSTPTIQGELLFAASQWGELVCLDKNTGKELWRKNYEKDFGGQRPEWGYAESPLVDGNKVVVTPGGEMGAMVALNATNGAVIWRSEGFHDPAHYSSIIVGEVGGVRQYIQLTAASVVGIAPETGKVLWRVARRGQTAVIPTPIFSDGFVYVTSGYGAGCNLYRINARDGTFSADQVYANKVMVNHHGGALKIGDCIYGYSDGKGWTCQDFKTGEAQWQEKERLGKGSLVYADGRLYLREESKKGTVALIEATASGYKEHGRFQQPERSQQSSWPHPVISGGKLYLRDQDLLLCYDLKPR